MSWYQSILGSNTPATLWGQITSSKFTQYALAAYEPVAPHLPKESILPSLAAVLALKQFGKISLFYQNRRTWDALVAAGSLAVLGTYAVTTRPISEVALGTLGLVLAGRAIKTIYEVTTTACSRNLDRIKDCFRREYKYTCQECHGPTNDKPRARLVECQTCNHWLSVEPNENGWYVLPNKVPAQEIKSE